MNFNILIAVTGLFQPSRIAGATEYRSTKQFAAASSEECCSGVPEMKEDGNDGAHPLEVTPEDSLDDVARRELLQKLARIGAAAIPVSVVLLDATDADASGGRPGGGRPTPTISWGN